MSKVDQYTIMIKMGGLLFIEPLHIRRVRSFIIIIIIKFTGSRSCGCVSSQVVCDRVTAWLQQTMTIKSLVEVL